MVAGHIYRAEFPYRIEKAEAIFNRLFIASLLLPNKLRFCVFGSMKRIYGDIFWTAYRLWLEEEEQIAYLKTYYRQLFPKKDFFQFMEGKKTQSRLYEPEFLNQIVTHILQHIGSVPGIGLLNGKMGCIVFFYAYSRNFKNKILENVAEDLLDKVWNEITSELPVNFANGLCGIGWAVEYLVEYRFIGGETSIILEELDKRVMERDPLRITDWSFNTGLGGILCYVACRLRSASLQGKETPFDKIYLDNLDVSASRLLTDEGAWETTKFALHYREYLRTGNWSSFSWELKDLITVPDVRNGDYHSLGLGLEGGCAAIGMKMMDYGNVK